MGFIFELEPNLVEALPLDPVLLSVQADSAGAAGDVRDVLMQRRSGRWEIGLSVKHNHQAVKHSRLSETIDFGRQWLELPCSDRYFSKIGPIFSQLRDLSSQGYCWRDLPDVGTNYYRPVLEAFVQEMLRIDSANPGEVPSRLMRYLLGRRDFYKVISQEGEGVTKIQAFVMSGEELNKAAQSLQPRIRLRRLRMPSEIIRLDFKRDVTAGTVSNNTLIMTCDEGWEVSFRIHSASSKVEPSLKFDIQLLGHPTSLFQHYEIWAGRV